jgi:hypothetical protein
MCVPDPALSASYCRGFTMLRALSASAKLDVG